MACPFSPKLLPDLTETGRSDNSKRIEQTCRHLWGNLNNPIESVPTETINKYLSNSFVSQVEPVPTKTIQKVREDEFYNDFLLNRIERRFYFRYQAPFSKGFELVIPTNYPIVSSRQKLLTTRDQFFFVPPSNPNSNAELAYPTLEKFSLHHLMNRSTSREVGFFVVGTQDDEEPDRLTAATDLYTIKNRMYKFYCAHHPYNDSSSLGDYVLFFNTLPNGRVIFFKAPDDHDFLMSIHWNYMLIHKSHLPCHNGWQ